jgi:hypothetical protein
MLCVNILGEMWIDMMTTKNLRTYSELIIFDSFDERFDYLKLDGWVGRSTFGFDRHINQRFYTSPEWHSVRDHVIIRDNGCDLGIPGYEIHISSLIHHMNPMTIDDILHREEWILDPEFLILTTNTTHNNIHFGANKLIPKVVTERTPRDTKLW